MINELWILQSKEKTGDPWKALTAPMPLVEIEAHVSLLLPAYRDANRQHYFRAYIIDDGRDDSILSWRALPDFPEFDHWSDVGLVAVMTDGTVWKKI